MRWKSLTRAGHPRSALLAGAACKMLRYPVHVFNVINGALKRRANSQRSDGVCCGAEVYVELRSCFEEAGMRPSFGDEGTFVFSGSAVLDAMSLLCSAIERAGYRAPQWGFLAIGAAANGFHNVDGAYSPEVGRRFSSSEMSDWWPQLVEHLPIVILEDPLHEGHIGGWERLTLRLGSHVILVGDYIFVTDPARLGRAIYDGLAGRILLKPNPIGAVSETIHTWGEAVLDGYKTVVSHRSGETSDIFIGNLAVVIDGDYIKAGAPARSERAEKYNRPLETEREMRAR